MANTILNFAEQEMVDGYLDGRDKDCPEPSANRTRSYRHGFQSGRNDLSRTSNAPFDVRMRQADECIKADMMEVLLNQ